MNAEAELFFFGKAKDRTAKICDKTLFNKLSIIPLEYLNTLTRDNGGENKDYENVEKELEIKVYYALPIILGSAEAMKTAMAH